MRSVAVALVAALALGGCGVKSVEGTREAPPPAGIVSTTGRPDPTATRPGQPDPAEVQEIEDVVNGLEGAVSSAEAATSDE